MRIWEQGLVATYSLPGYREMILEHYAEYQRPGTEIVIHGVRDATSPAAAKIAGSAVNFAYLHRFHDNQVLANVQQAEREGFDAVILGVLQDPALREAKSIVDIPVIGYGEASMVAAIMLGARFTFVCINPEMDALVRDRIREKGLEARAAPTAFMSCGYPDLYAAVQGQPEKFLTAFQAAAKRAVEFDGVDVLLPGQTIIAELLWKHRIKSVDGACVLDPRLALLRLVELNVDLRRAGMGMARRGFYGAKPPQDLMDAIRAFYQI